ncbi:MAG: class I SAM-dependent rRNA methyltransferase [Verrucomicrobia bacterium]|nr:class I SAM-dependent rRNA methyltransferase [Verrucomicrobiota bacterium]
MTQWESQLQAMPNSQTTTGRVLHGSALGRSDIRIDQFDGHWLVQTRDGDFPNELRNIAPRLARSVWWKKLDKDAKSAPEWVEGEKLTAPFPVKENDTDYLIDFAAGYSQGLFLDQRLNREKLHEKIQADDRVLNCFAYTCSFSVVTAQAGGIATSMDLSPRYLEWGKENFRINQIDPDDHYFCKGDVMDWLKRFARQGRTFRGVILDPPTFSRNGKKIFKVENDYTELVRLAASVLDESGGWLLCSTNHHQLHPWQFEPMLCEGVDLADRYVNKVETTPMPPEFEGDDYLKSFWLDVE